MAKLKKKTFLTVLISQQIVLFVKLSNDSPEDTNTTNPMMRSSSETHMTQAEVGEWIQILIVAIPLLVMDFFLEKSNIL